jgi:hypothetical protein
VETKVMMVGSSLIIFILVIGIMFLFLYVSVTYSAGLVIPTAALSQDDAIRIVEDDFRGRQTEYDRITAIIAHKVDRYVPIKEFRDHNLKLPLVYVHPNGSLLDTTENGYENLGQCDSGRTAYCGFLDPYFFDYRGRLVYGVEVFLGNEQFLEGRGFPFLYIVDAKSGEIVDSSFLRVDSKTPSREE